MPTIDAAPVADPTGAFLDSRRRSRERRRERARARRRRAVQRRGAIALVTASALGGGVSVAHQQRGHAGPAKVAAAAGLLESGDRGSAVRALQQALGVEADGIYGAATRRAVRRFQRRRGLVVDGVAGPRTLAALGLVRSRPARALTGSRMLERIALCESGGDPRAVSADGRYRGKYQFSRDTWRALGGSGDPAAAPEAEQDRRAAALLAQAGTAPWPSCG